MGNYLIVLRNKIEKIENVKLFLYIKQKKLSYLYSKSLICHKLLIGLEEIQKFSEVIKSINENSNIVISKAKKSNLRGVEVLEYRVFSNDKYLEIIFFDLKDVFNIVEYFNNYEVISDKDEILADENLQNQNIQYWEIPDRDEYIEECIEFYVNLLRVFVNRKDGNILKSNLVKSEVLDGLINIINVYLSIKYSNNIMVDTYGSGLETYLEREYYDELVALMESMDIWTFIFKSAQLFRKVAMIIAEEKKYIYPKKQDVEIMKYLRDMYEEENL